VVVRLSKAPGVISIVFRANKMLLSLNGVGTLSVRSARHCFLRKPLTNLALFSRNRRHNFSITTIIQGLIVGVTPDSEFWIKAKYKNSLQIFTIYLGGSGVSAKFPDSPISCAAGNFEMLWTDLRPADD